MNRYQRILILDIDADSKEGADRVAAKARLKTMNVPGVDDAWRVGEENPLHITITGNPVDGMVFRGPFVDANEAGDYAGANHSRTTWWVAPLLSPDEEH